MNTFYTILAILILAGALRLSFFALVNILVDNEHKQIKD